MFEPPHSLKKLVIITAQQCHGIRRCVICYKGVQLSELTTASTFRVEEYATDERRYAGDADTSKQTGDCGCKNIRKFLTRNEVTKKHERRKVDQYSESRTARWIYAITAQEN
jgi:hypothetical protein